MRTNYDDLIVCYKEVLAAQNGTDENFTIASDLRYILFIGAILLRVTIFLGVVSTTVSIVNLSVFTRKIMLESSFNWLLLTLEVANLSSSVLVMFSCVIKHVFGRHPAHYAVGKSHLLADWLAFTVSSFTNWLTVAIGLWRLMAVAAPSKMKFSMNKRTVIIIIVILLICVGLPHLFFETIWCVEPAQVNICTDMDSKNTTSMMLYEINFCSWAMNAIKPKLFVVVINIMCYLLPCICFFVITVFLIRSIVKQRRKSRALRNKDTVEKEQIRTTIILLGLLTMFLLSTTVPVVFRIVHVSSSYYAKVRFEWYFFMYFLSKNMSGFVTNSVSFVAYYYMGTKFRETFHSLLPCKKHSGNNKLNKSVDSAM